MFLIRTSSSSSSCENFRIDWRRNRKLRTLSLWKYATKKKCGHIEWVKQVVLLVSRGLANRSLHQSSTGSLNDYIRHQPGTGGVSMPHLQSTLVIWKRDVIYSINCLAFLLKKGFQRRFSHVNHQYQIYQRDVEDGMSPKVARWNMYACKCWLRRLMFKLYFYANNFSESSAI